MNQKIIGISAFSPVRCVDIGGWLDTWFAKYGNILNLSVLSRYYGSNGPFRGIKVAVSHRLSEKNSLIEIHAADPTYDVSIAVEELLSGDFNHKNLLLATLFLTSRELKKCFPKNTDTVIEINSPIPPGASLGTSAAVAVTIIKALCNANLSKEKIAKIAWRAETEIMGGQSGTQDQFAASFGNPVNFITVNSFPNTSCQPVKISRKTKMALEEGLLTIFYGHHDSSSSHLKVIRELENEGPETPRLQALRPLATKALDCLNRDDLAGFGKVMQENTVAQASLAEGIISVQASSVIKLAKLHRTALGWKVNGAGGAGGSITLLFHSKKAAKNFYQDCLDIFPAGQKFYFEHKLC